MPPCALSTSLRHVLTLSASLRLAAVPGCSPTEQEPRRAASLTLAQAAPPHAPAAPLASPEATEPKGTTGATELSQYIRKRLPPGGSLQDEPIKITHEVQPGETLASIARAYLELTEHYRVDELQAALKKKHNSFAPGKTITLDRPLSHMPEDPRDERLGWPEDKILRGVFSTGIYASIKWAELVDLVARHGLNAIVLDAKDYDGYVNYPSKAKVAVESRAIRAGLIPDLTRAIRYAHWQGVRVILRIPCFHDPWADKHLPDGRLSMRFAPTQKPVHIDWIDPTSKEAQDYAIELAQEGLDAGADEIQLDYVRFPVHVGGDVIKLPPKEERSTIIANFVRRVHEVTSREHAYLSLDFFGVAATGIRDDIEKLGQDIATVAPEADAISLMSYPSHYGKGYLGFSNPADHPEIIGVSIKKGLEQLAPTGKQTIFRTWLQAFPLGVTNYNSAYLLGQAKSAETSGGHGWLMWSPGCEYSHVWSGWPAKPRP